MKGVAHDVDDAPNSVLRSLDRALRILACFDVRNPESGVSQVAAHLGINKTVAYRIMSTLARHGYLAQDPGTRRYRLGPKGLPIDREGTVAILARLAMPYLEILAAETGETSVMNLLMGLSAVCIAKAESPGRAKITYDIGLHTPLHAGASARAILAYQPQQLLDVLFAQGLPRLTPNTLDDPHALVQALRSVREYGIAISHGEADLGLAAVAAPIRDCRGHVIASVSVVGLAATFCPDREQSLISPVRKTAADISETLIRYNIGL